MRLKRNKEAGGRSSSQKRTKSKNPHEEDSMEHEERSLDKSRLAAYLKHIFDKRAERLAITKPPTTWRAQQESLETLRKKRPLVALEEGANRSANKHVKDIQKRNMELAIQSCLLLARKNQHLLQRSSDEEGGSEGNDREESGDDSSNRSLSAHKGLRRSKIIRTKTAYIPGLKIRAKKRFTRKQSADLLRKRSAPDSSELEPLSENAEEEEVETETDNEPMRTRSSRLNSSVKKTGRGPGRPRLAKKIKKTTNVQIKKRLQKKVKLFKTPEKVKRGQKPVFRTTTKHKKG